MNDSEDFDINYIAQLARIDLSEDEKSKLGAQLDQILGHFDALKAVDVSGVEPTAHAHPVENVWRTNDTPGPVLDSDVLIAMAPESRDNQVVVPKVVE
jgi:aspartyl-tRNA(Asn)/glutamyl-tRNA(Gln) amidotransferase subunit C